jgi:hypothetical protein
VGGTFPGDDPTQPVANNLALDLGMQDPISGLYRNARVTYLGATYPAVAVVGNPEGKYVVLVLGQDTGRNLPALLYLLQQ